jgi:hypothetical protein
MASISKAFLLELEIPIPSLKNQGLIIKISELQKKEYYLRREIENLQEEHILQQLITAAYKRQEKQQNNTLQVTKPK